MTDAPDYVWRLTLCARIGGLPLWIGRKTIEHAAARQAVIRCAVREADDG